MKSSLKILYLEDEPLDVELVKSALEEEGIASKIFRVEARDDFIEALEQELFDIIFADHSLPGFDGLSALAIARERCPGVPFILISGTMGEELAIETLKRGATDYVLKDRITRLAPSVRRALEEAKAKLDHMKAVKELKKSHKQLRNLAAHLQSAREEERSNIAREIHDELGQTLTALKMDLSVMDKKLETNQGIETLSELVKADLQLVNATINTVKKLCTELRPSILDHLGLGAAIEWQAQEFQKRCGIECELNMVPEDITVGGKHSIALFRIFQESLTNALRHAKATKVKVTLNDLGDSIMLEIADNGVGIREEHMSKANSFGLLGMRERVQICNGEMRVVGGKNGGTTITVIIPKYGEDYLLE
ncbi:MAG TPA: response regulator [Dissulfurispiraceae bacterium]|nr:response regulator [Dissulfurispiraceae bacterium]